MSKQKRNTVDPAEIIEHYGADTARWFMLSDSPPERDLEWTEAGVEGAFRFLRRLWRQVAEVLPDLPPVGTASPEGFSETAQALRRAAHKAIAGVSRDIEEFHFNRAVARVHELSNQLSAFEFAGPGDAWALREAMEILARLIGPMMPHLAEELWEQLGHTQHLVEEPWPAADPALLVEDLVTLPVQVNGKKRATIDVAATAADDQVRESALAHPLVQRALEGKAPRKVIVVPKRIVNVVA